MSSVVKNFVELFGLKYFTKYFVLYFMKYKKPHDVFK